MAYYICEIKTDTEHEADVTALLENAGASGVSAEGASLVKKSIREGHAEIWDEEQLENADTTLILKGYFPTDDDFAEHKEQLTAAAAL